VVRLTEIFRQAAESRIVINAHRVNQGLMPDFTPVEGGDFYFVDAADAEGGVRKLRGVQLLRAGYRQYGSLGALRHA